MSKARYRTRWTRIILRKEFEKIPLINQDKPYLLKKTPSETALHLPLLINQDKPYLLKSSPESPLHLPLLINQDKPYLLKKSPATPLHLPLLINQDKPYLLKKTSPETSLYLGGKISTSAPEPFTTKVLVEKNLSTFSTKVIPC